MTTITQRPYTPVHAPRSSPQRPGGSAVGHSVPRVRPVSPVRAVPASSSRARLGAIVTWRNIAIVVLAVVALSALRLVISVGNDATAYTISEKTRESVNLARDAEFIQEQLNVLNSPQYLSETARALGMISNSRPAYLRISDGKVWGNPRVAGGGSIDRTSIANALKSTLISSSTAQGVASETNESAKADSESASTTEVATTGIPAPDTH